MARSQLSSEFLQFLAALPEDGGDPVQLPSLNELSAVLNISVARLREQLEVAKALGLVDVRPRTGIRRRPYSFTHAVYQSLAYAMELDRATFEPFADLRNQVEAVYWREAVRALQPEDHTELRSLVQKAWEKLRGPRVQIPHSEHRELHLTIFRRLENPFVLGILEAYWLAYEAVGLNVYAGYEYLQQVWQYHQEMVDAICAGDLEAGYHALVEHKDLLYHRPAFLAENSENGA
jgi:DNA-binding FadR family transcriptional regulator